MKKYLIDTNIISELRKPRPHGAVIAWVETIPDEYLFISSVTIGEIQAGIEITRERDAEKADAIELWLDQVAVTYNIIPMDTKAYRCWAKLMHRQSDSLYEDAMIAAIAISNDLTVATRNIRDFSGFPVPLYNPFEFRC